MARLATQSIEEPRRVRIERVFVDTNGEINVDFIVYENSPAQVLYEAGVVYRSRDDMMAEINDLMSVFNTSRLVTVAVNDLRLSDPEITNVQALVGKVITLRFDVPGPIIQISG